MYANDNERLVMCSVPKLVISTCLLNMELNTM